MKRSRLTKRERAAERDRRKVKAENERQLQRAMQQSAGLGTVRTRWITLDEARAMYPAAEEQA